MGIDENNPNVFVQNNHTTLIDLYAHIDKVFPVITVDTSIDDKSVVVDSIVDVAAGDVIVFYEINRVFQSIVLSATGNTINFASPLDYAFTTNGIIHVGTWNLAVNGFLKKKVSYIPVVSLTKLSSIVLFARSSSSATK